MVPLLGELGFGTANIGNLHREVSEDEAWEALQTAWDCGIRYFDTAPHYGLGLAERRLGAFLASKNRSEFTVSTKVGRLLRPNKPALTTGRDGGFYVDDDLTRVWDLSADGVRASLEESLNRMQLDRVDVLYLHDPEQAGLDLADHEAYPAMMAMRAEGIVSSIGTGSMSTAALERAASHHDLDILMVAGRLTLAEQPVARHVLPLAEHNHTRVVAAGIYNSGMLANWSSGAVGRYEYGSDVPEELQRRVVRIADICNRHDVPLATAALHYPRRFSCVVNVLFGADKPHHIRDNTDRMAAQVPEDLWAELRSAGLIAWPEGKDQ